MLEIEIIESNIIDGGVEVFARAWRDGKQIGFGKDGSVDIERFRIFNPPVLVEDPLGDIVRVPAQSDGDFIERPSYILREDPEEAILQSLEHTISTMKNQSGSSNIIAGKRGNTTSTFYPSAGAVSPVDGVLIKTNANWSTTRNSTTAAIVDLTSDLQFGQGEFCAVCSNKYIICRNVLLFDTASIPDTDTISSATLSVYAISTGASTNGDTSNIYSCSTASTSSLTSTDYNITNWGSTAFCDSSKSLSTLTTTTGYIDYALNASGIANISKTGVSYFGERSGNDVSNSTPASRGYALVRSADIAGTANDPKLVVEHAAGGGATANNSARRQHFMMM